MSVSLLRTVLLYLCIVVGMRIMGKRQLGELQPSELVVTILISNIATLPIEDSNISLLGGLIPIFTIICFEVFASTLTMKFKRARSVISGTPRAVIRDGKVDQKELQDLRLTVEDLMEQLRTSGIFDIREVAFAIVETTGRLSVFPKFASRPTTAGMLQLPDTEQQQAPPTILISDGELMEGALDYCNLRWEWLEHLLGEKELRIQDIFLMTCDRKADYYIVLKEKKA